MSIHAPSETEYNRELADNLRLYMIGTDRDHLEQAITESDDNDMNVLLIGVKNHDPVVIGTAVWKMLSVHWAKDADRDTQAWADQIEDDNEELARRRAL